MLIRLAEEKDIPGILDLLLQVELVHHAIRPDIFRNGAMKYDEAALKALLQDKTRPIFVAVRDDFVAGYCFCQLRDVENSVFHPRRELYIDDLGVDENFRSQGIATSLYNHALEYSRSQKCQYLTLNVWCGNESAVKFYEKCGLRPRNIMMEMPLEGENAE